MVKTSRALVAAVLLAFAALVAGCSEDKAPRGEDDLRADLAALRDQIEEAKKVAEQHPGGLLGEMAAMRREVLLLSAAMLENRLIADESGVPSKMVAPARPPDPARAEQLLRHIAATEESLEQAREAASSREGVAGSLSQTAVVTQELTLAQLRLAYFQSAYGLALPDQEEAGRTGSPAPVASAGGGSQPPPVAVDPAPAPTRVDRSGEAGRQNGRSQDIGDLLGSVKSKAAGGDKAAALPPLEEVEVPQLPPVTYSRSDYARIQLLLEEAGFNPGPVDGQWGPRTARAMASFQRAKGLPADGEPDAETLDALGFY
jgi:hypothetical protein